MNKAADAFRTISEVASLLDVPKHVLRFWEAKFPQIKPMKRGGGRRYYRPEDLELLRGIRKLLHGDGYTIKGVQRILRDEGIDHVKSEGRSVPDFENGKAPAKRAIRKIKKAKAGRDGRSTAPVAGVSSSKLPGNGSQGVTLESLIDELEACRSLLTKGIAVAPEARKKASARRQRAG